MHGLNVTVSSEFHKENLSCTLLPPKSLTTSLLKEPTCSCICRVMLMMTKH